MDFTTALAAEFEGVDGEIGHHRHEAMKSLQEICDLARKHKLRKLELVRWRWLAALHMFHYARCGFHVYPKFHYFMHMPEQVERGGVPRTHAGCNPDPYVSYRTSYGFFKTIKLLSKARSSKKRLAETRNGIVEATHKIIAQHA